MRYQLFAFALLATFSLKAQIKTVTEDRDWSKHFVELKNSLEAEYIIRIGDVDNLGFGWPDNFDPFCGQMTSSHFFPWEADPNEMAGFDRILLSSKFKKDINPNDCSSDGYAAGAESPLTPPAEFSLSLKSINGATIKDAYLQLFIDDFQAPVFCSRFIITLNGNRFVEAEKLINAIEQTGPVGKLVTIPIPEQFYPEFAKNELRIKIDEATGAHDGFALDFIRLMINRTRENSCKGDVEGIVTNKQSGEPIAKATVFLSDKTMVTTDARGHYKLKNVPAGLEIIGASADGYEDGSGTADVAQDNVTEVNIALTQSNKKATFDNKAIRAGETITLNAILFDQGKAALRNESKTELDKIATFLKTYPTAEIELAGHTSSEGDRAQNRSLSYQRVKACKDYIIAKGIDESRIVSVGYGPDRPVAPNDTEANRARNRRAEMRVLKL